MLYIYIEQKVKYLYLKMYFYVESLKYKRNDIINLALESRFFKSTQFVSRELVDYVLLSVNLTN